MELIKASFKDILDLQKICIRTYSQSFYTHWEEGGLQWYLEKEFSIKRLETDLKDSDCCYYFIKKELNTVGFIKTSTKSTTSLPNEDNLELEKLYVLPEYKGIGIGKFALNKIIIKARGDAKKNLFLSVIDTNANAISFYKKIGFEFHSKTTLEVPFFKEELKGMYRMVKLMN